jgi:hypothetical protein
MHMAGLNKDLHERNQYIWDYVDENYRNKIKIFLG